MKIPKDFAHVEKLWNATTSTSLLNIPSDFNIPFVCTTETDSSSVSKK